MDDIKTTTAGLGDVFPEMTVKTTQGVKHLPDDYKGEWVVLFSHPGDFTPVCTTEFIGFSKKMKEFEALNTKLIGLSVDQLQSHLKWVEWINENSDTTIKFPIIADELGIVATKLGMLHKAKGTNTVRAVYILDEKGVIRLTMFYPQEVGRSVNEVLRALKALQISTKNGVACAENYPDNDFIGKNKVIVPPASTEKEIEQRKEAIKKGELESKDWWLCYRDL